MIDIAKKQADVETTTAAMAENAKKGEIHEVMAVTFDHAGQASVYYAGNWQKLGTAAAFLQSEFNRYVWGDYS